MSTVASPDPIVTTPRPAASPRADALATRLEEGAAALVRFAREATTADWQARLPTDRRPAGVIVHHVASMYPLEIQLAQALGAGEAITGVTWDAVAAMNAEHARTYEGVGRSA